MTAIDSKDGYIWMDGEFKNWPEAKVHVLTHALHYGSSVFDGIRVYNNKPFKIIDHLDRLRNSAKQLGMNVEYTSKQLAQICMDLTEKNNQQNVYIRPFIWRGSENLRVGGYNRVHIAIACWDTKEDGSIPFEKKDMVKLTLSQWRRAPQNVFPASIKGAGAYVLNTVAKHNAEGKGFNDALILDVEGNVAEATTSNIFLVKDGILITPPPVQILNGITRCTVIDIAREMGIKVVEKFFGYPELLTADEVFLTGTSIEISAVEKIDEQEFHLGEITKKIANRFAIVKQSGGA